MRFKVFVKVIYWKWFLTSSRVTLMNGAGKFWCYMNLQVYLTNAIIVITWNVTEVLIETRAIKIHWRGRSALSLFAWATERTSLLDATYRNLGLTVLATITGLTILAGFVATSLGADAAATTASGGSWASMVKNGEFMLFSPGSLLRIFVRKPSLSAMYSTTRYKPLASVYP